MRQQTDLMRSILTSETAQKMIDYVSPRYGKSYVGLWLFQAIGASLDNLYDICAQMRYEANPATATLLLDQWEDHYGLDRAPYLAAEQRRERILAKQRTRGACTPEKLAAAVSKALGGVEVEVTENVAKNTFRVIVLADVESLDPAIDVIERMKPAHLIYQLYIEIRTYPTADIKTATAVTYHEGYSLEVVEQEEDPNKIFVAGETLVANVEGVTADGETVEFAADLAASDGESLIIN